MTSLHIGTVTSKFQHIPDAQVRVVGAVPLSCGGTIDKLVTSSADGVADINLGDFCGIPPGPAILAITVKTQKGRTASQQWTIPLVAPASDYNIDIIVPDADDEGSWWADAAAWWGGLGPIAQTGIVIGAIVLGGITAYGIARYASRPKPPEEK